MANSHIILVISCLLIVLIERWCVCDSLKYSINVEDIIEPQEGEESDNLRVSESIPHKEREIPSIEKDLEQKYRIKIEEKVLEISNRIASKGSKSKGIGYI